jgi:anaerobic magnesium-protoporphyrin IX monomethyl ester cyclase
MNSKIDCLLIGHNEMDFREYEGIIRESGTRSGAYRDLNLNFLRCDNSIYHASAVFNRFFPEVNGVGDGFRPLGIMETFSATLAYLGTYLHRRGLGFDYVHSFQQGKEELARKLKELSPLTVAVTTTLYVAVYPVLEIVEFIRRHRPETRIIVGGPFIASQARLDDAGVLDYLFRTMAADFYVDSSQGEATLVRLITALKNRLTPEDIPNLYYRSGNRYRKTYSREESNDLSQNPVDWTLFSRELDQCAAVRTSVSCPFSCAFCGFPQHAGAYRTMDIDVLERELSLLHQAGPAASLYFIDDTFNVPKNRFKEILRRLIRKGYPGQWHAHLRCQFLDRETAALMKQSGCEGVFLGLESGSNRILANMNKHVKVEHYLEGIALLKDFDIPVFGCFIVGFPGETQETFTETLQFIEASKIDFYRAQLWYADPLTPVYRERARYRLTGAQFKWSHGTMDAETACDLVDHLFLTIKNPTWLPLYHFDFVTLFHLLRRGLGWGWIKTFLTSFNNGIAEKLHHPSGHEISRESLTQLKTSLLAVPAKTPGCKKTARPDKTKPDKTKPDKTTEEELIIDFDLAQ